MGRTIRTAALGLGLAIAGSSTPVGIARAQVPYTPPPARTYSVPYSPPARAYVPAAPRYVVAPYYRHQDGYFQMNRGGPAFNRHYGYSPARRPNETYKPWLQRD